MRDWQDVSLWEETAPPGPHFPPLTAARKAEVAVIGAGYTGLSAALHLAEAGRGVVVLEALRVGDRASGRNGGQVIPGVKHDPDELEEMLGPRLGPATVASVGGAAGLVFDLIARHHIDCDAQRSGWLNLGLRAADLPALTRRAAQWQRRGADVAALDAREAARLTGSTVYAGGWIDRRAGTVQPLAYVRGLARAAAAAGARIHASSPVTGLARVGGLWQLDTPGGAVSAPVVILATGTYTDRIADRLRRTLIAVPSFQVATAPLPAALRAAILPEGQAVSDTARLLRYFRLDREGRLVLGTRGFFSHVPLAKALQPHARALAQIYPQLAGQPFTHYWGGLVGMTPDHMPHLHEAGPGLLAALGCNGRGVAIGTLFGRLLAEWAAGRPAAELAYPVSPVRPIPLHRFNQVGARAAVQYFRMLDGLAQLRDGTHGRGGRAAR